ncbi:MAG: response regulator [Novosphingobium sp.]|nr:response regulator [Novosphingobium sp.]
MHGKTTAPKILIVEDEFLVALQIEDVVSSRGYQVVAIVPDQATFERVDDAPQVALVDLNLRDGLTGPEIARRLSSKFGCKIVYVTANPADIDRPAPTAVGIVPKPFSGTTILDAIEFALNGVPNMPPPSGVQPLAR